MTCDLFFTRNTLRTCDLVNMLKKGFYRRIRNAEMHTISTSLLKLAGALTPSFQHASVSRFLFKACREVLLGWPPQHTHSGTLHPSASPSRVVFPFSVEQDWVNWHQWTLTGGTAKEGTMGVQGALALTLVCHCTEVGRATTGSVWYSTAQE